MPQPLAPKEAAQFRAVIRSYEDRQYKRSLKTADIILKKHPKHGDTMAMKALIFNSQGKTDEAFALAKEALTVDMKSHVCWHVYGLLYRTAKNFEEATKAYKFALKLESESAQIQRDLAILQIQMRDYAGYTQSRTAMLQARPQLRQNWTALAIAQHLDRNLSDAENVLKTYEDTLKSVPSRYDIEHSEAVMYQNTLIAEQGEYERALKHLDDAAKENLDRLAVLEARANYLIQLGRKKEASEACRALIERNSEHPAYYHQLIATLDIADEDHKARKEVYDLYASKFPRCDAARRIPLDFLTGDMFAEAARAYLTLMFNKGVPSTFANLKHLYSNPQKKDALKTLALDYLQLQPKDSSSKDSGEAAALYYLAQHYDYRLSRDMELAMDYTERVIEKDPKSVDFHMTKARILKHSGDLEKACEVMDYARKLDLKDRYINNKAAKYQLRNDHNDKALETVGLFTRAETAGGPLADLVDMQCIWYLTEDGEAHARQGRIGLALKRFHAVNNIFDVWQEDQFDFHSFSLRKGQIRAYIDMIRWEDHLRDHPFYSRAALDAIHVYLKMASRHTMNGVNGVQMGNVEDALAKKKANKKARKEQERLEKEAAEKLAKRDPNKGAHPPADAKKDDDPQGLKLAATTEPLNEAVKILSPLLQACPKSVEAQLAGFEVHMKRSKYILALRCLKTVLQLEPENPKAHEQIVAFRNMLNVGPNLPPKVAEAVFAEFTVVGESTNLHTYIENFQDKHKTSPLHVLSAIRSRKMIGEESTKCEKELKNLLYLDSTTAEHAIEIWKTLTSWSSLRAEDFRKSAQVKWPNVTRLARAMA